MTDLQMENVQSYPRPPALEPVPQRIEIVLGGQIVVHTDQALRVLETHHAPNIISPPKMLPQFCSLPKEAVFANGRALRDTLM